MDTLSVIPPPTIVEDETVARPQQKPAATPDAAYTARKGELPIFSGDNPDSWLWRAERYLCINVVPDKDYLECIMLYLEGDALNGSLSRKNTCNFPVGKRFARGRMSDSTR